MNPLPFRNPELPLEVRLDDLLGRLTLDERIEMLHQYQPAIDRLGIAGYKHGTEAAHGIAWLGKATMFPQPIGLAATWDPELLRKVGSAIGDEARGFYRRNPEVNGLTLWAPTVDLERDPRWGRTEEAYGEDPFLVGELASALVQ
jgi:beta-glucosidase